MKHFYAIVSLMLLLSLGGGGLAISGGGGKKEISAAPSFPSIQIVRGMVIRIEGEFLGSDFSTTRDTVYFVRDKYGRNIRLDIGERTQILDPIDLGDQIIARVSQNGVVLLVQKAQ